MPAADGKKNGWHMAIQPLNKGNKKRPSAFARASLRASGRRGARQE
ncbi:MAG: hypothetical protein ABJA69_12550 [Acidobacteriaceae bacterium]